MGRTTCLWTWKLVNLHIDTNKLRLKRLRDGLEAQGARAHSLASENNDPFLSSVCCLWLPYVDSGD